MNTATMTNNLANNNDTSNTATAEIVPAKRRLSNSTEKDKDKKRPTMSNSSSSKPTLIDSEKMVHSCLSKYRPYFIVDDYSEETADSRRSTPNAADLKVTLEYPGAREEFLLLRPVLKTGKTAEDMDVEDKDEYNPIYDLMKSIRYIYEYYLTPEQRERLGDDSQGIMRNLTKYRNRRNGNGFVKAVEDFNRVIRELKDNGEISRNAKAMRHPSYELAVHIMYQVYSRTVARQADALNNYQAFSNNVYGEINPTLIKEFIQKTRMNSRSVFMDMGCGIGNVVLQVAAQTGCEAYGIEIMEVPCKYAKRQLREYAARMKAWKMPLGKVHFRQGDFLDLAASGLHETLRRADVVLVNNYAFDWQTNHGLAQLFLDLKEGAKVISLKSFVPKSHKINQRTFHMPESILRVKEYEYFSDAVSWTSNGGTYYIATVDRSRLKPFYEGMYKDSSQQ